MRLTIAAIKPEEIEIPIGWAAREGWNPGLDDGPAFYHTDPGGFLMARQKERPIGVISAVRYGTGFGFIGLFLVERPFRGLLTGVKLGSRALEHLDGRIIGTDGVVAKQEQYIRLAGFRRAYRNVRHAGIISLPEPPPKADIIPAESVSFEDLVAYDSVRFMTPRAAFLQGWITMPQARSLVLREDGRITGFGVIRPCRKGCKIGPLFARDEERADLLFRHLAHPYSGEPVILDTPEPNQAAVALARRHGMSVVFETARMYRGGMPELPVHEIFGVTTFELG
jgi:hypothetical protein